MAYRFPRLYAAIAVPVLWIRLFLVALVVVSMGFGVDLAAKGLMLYPDWLDQLLFMVRAAMLSVFLFFGLTIATLAYFIPTISAWRKHKRLRRVISVLNLFVGWTIFGWLILLAWAYTSDKETEAVA
jgi:hypothetical protein